MKKTKKKKKKKKKKRRRKKEEKTETSMTASVLKQNPHMQSVQNNVFIRTSRVCQALDIAYPQKISGLDLHLIFHRFSRLIVV